MTKDLAVVTMVYDDTDYLHIWLGYWRKQLPEDQLYVLVHGGNPGLETMAEGTNVVVVPRPDPYPEMEEDRWRMLSEFVSGLLKDYRVAVYTDVDEILVTDPASGTSIAQALSQARAPVSHAFGLEIIHRGDLEPPLSSDRPVLAQRGFYRINTFHAKPCIVTAQVRWGRGGHFQDRRGIPFLRGIFCFHLRFYDETIFLERSERRRQSTRAPEGLDQNPHRLWRTSDTAARDLLESFRATPVTGSAWLFRIIARLKVWRNAASRPDDKGFYTYRRFADPRLHRIPARFKSLF